MTVSALAAKLEAASFAYFNGLEELMTDAEYDAGVDALRSAAPDHPFFKKVVHLWPPATKSLCRFLFRA